ncbi:MAG: IS5 family transposase [Synergistaceae bacterium]|nr:IS5 family transposase [Synergistaceae bacterium]
MNSVPAYRRHDISDKAWKILKPHLPRCKGTKCRAAHYNRNFINAVFWILRTGAPWRDLPPDYGDWKNTNRRFCRWRNRGVWAKLVKLLASEHEYKWLMIEIDATFVKVHPTQPEPLAAIRRWGVQKGTKYENTYGSGRSW